jgi:hypothetical protein
MGFTGINFGKLLVVFGATLLVSGCGLQGQYSKKMELSSSDPIVEAARKIKPSPTPSPTSTIDVKPSPSPTQAPFGDAAVSIPGKLQAENFDLGGESVAYHDLDSINQGDSTYRVADSGVDLKISADAENGIAVGWMQTGEWLEYSVNITQAANYTLRVRATSALAGGAFHVEVNGVDKTGAISVPNTGQWGTAWKNVERSGISLTAGPAIIRLFVDQEYFDLDSFEFFLGTSTSPSPTPVPSPTPTYGGVGPVPGATCPSGSTAIYPGQSIQLAVDGNVAGATFCIKSGTHRLQEIRPKSYQSFIGESGAVLSGAKLLTAFTREGSYWVAAGQTQGGTLSGACRDAYPRCNRAENLFINDVQLRHVATLAEVGPGKYHFNYDTDKIYFYDDPTGKNVETSIIPYAFLSNSAGSVTITGLIVEKYATPAQQGTIKTVGGNAWIVENNEVRLNHGFGIAMSNGIQVLRNHVHHNGQMGVGGSSNQGLVDGNEISYNNWAGFNPYWEAGATKFTFSDGLTVRNNFVHHNDGSGLWTDINNINILYENNRVEDNTINGIFHEISYRAIIRNNISRRNGTLKPFPGWVEGSGIVVSNSSDTEVYGNTVEDNYQGIMGVETDRGAGPYGTYTLRNLYVHHNTVIQKANLGGGSGRTGLVQANGQSYAYTNANNRFVSNSYFLGTFANYFHWNHQEINETQWKAYGQDVTGEFTR